MARQNLRTEAPSSGKVEDSSHRPAGTIYDLVVLGAGPGGYSCALRAAQRGLRVAVVEKERVGGVCLNRGCIPTKVLLQAASFLRSRSHAAKLGVELGQPQLDWPRLMQRKAEVVKWLTSGVEALLYKRQVDVIYGTARLAADGMVGIDSSDGHRVIRGACRVIATGSSERALPGIAIDGKIVISSTDALQLPELPGSIAIIGAGAVGTEFASMFADFGCEVTLIEALPRILPLEDEESSQIVAAALEQRGVHIHANTPVRGLSIANEGANLTCEGEGHTFAVVADKVLIAIGRKPNTAELGLEALGVKMTRGYVDVDSDLRSSVPDIFAIGDCIFTLALAHVATAEGKYVAELLSGGRPRRLLYDNMPRATYCEPEVASVGLTEAQAREQGLNITVSRFPMRNSGKAAVYGQMEGLVKIISERPSGLVLGVHIVGHSAPELIAEAALAMQLEATAAEIAETVHAHPTISEAVMECAEGILDTIRE